MTAEPIQTRWAQQLGPLDDQQRQAVVNALANGIHEGWKPTDADVTRLVDYARGAVDEETYKRAALARARRDG
ncbi:hypothetical protein [Brachybacterium sp. J153]|uniref:antitoxin VbhA family protein n=1 Tax=Brachybacterium sp. J153 TaxID=3116488 RepID=UPI002E77A541|nr:hypothetical protein [Brachybacterium sp. J153]MEE1619746.1 hypothetical protein [Brachybacterium sp. J153]